MLVTNRNKKNLYSKGYNVNDEYVYCNVDDLTKGSHCKIKVKCSNCGDIKNVEYKNYIKQTNNNTTDYYCVRCKSIKIKNTTKLRYGEDSVFKLKKYQEKAHNSIFEKYGVYHALQNSVVMEKMKENLLNEYNLDNVSKLPNVKDKKRDTLSTTWFDRLCNKHSDINIISADYDKKMITCYCDQNKKHNFEISYDLLYNRKLTKSIICTVCHKIGRNNSSVEKKFYNFISEYYDGEIIMNDRKRIKPYELDIYLPELKIAFEFNGFKWHSDKRVGVGYHKMKTDMCNNVNVQLIHFYQDDWIYRESIVKSIILNKIGKTQNKIYARKCIIGVVKYNEYKDFMIKNHIQGYATSKYIFGLFKDDILVAVMSLGNRKISGKMIFELIRFGTLINTNVIGGFSKLLKYVKNNIDIVELITYANKSYSNGKLYELNGFKYDGETKPNYYYIVNNKRKHRFGFRKSILVKKGFDKNKTEMEIMDDNGVIRIYDSGNKRYKLKI